MISKQQFADAIDQINARFDWFTAECLRLQLHITSLEAMALDQVTPEPEPEKADPVPTKPKAKGKTDGK